MPKGVYQHKSLIHSGSFVKGHIGYNKGIPCSEEVKRKISLKNKGKPASAGSFKVGHKRMGNY